MYTYKALITNVVDGDTFDATIDLGFKIYTKQRLRLCFVDTPEIYRPSCEAEKLHGLEAKKFVQEKILNQTVTIVSHKATEGVFNRWECEIMLDGGFSLGDILKELGLLKKEKY